MIDRGQPSEPEEWGTCLIYVPENPFEADILSGALAREGIPSSCRHHEETAYDGIFVPQKGWGAIYVPLSFRDRALEIVQEVLKTYPKKQKAP